MIVLSVYDVLHFCCDCKYMYIAHENGAFAPFSFFCKKGFSAVEKCAILDTI